MGATYNGKKAVYTEYNNEQNWTMEEDFIPDKPSNFKRYLRNFIIVVAIVAAMAAWAISIL